MPRHSANRTSNRLIQIALVLDAVFFVVVALFVEITPYSPVDLQITRIVQSFNQPWLVILSSLTSFVGFFPQVVIWIGVVVVALFVLGYRWEAISTLFAAVGNAVLETLVKSFIVRPRPSPELVHVSRNLNGLVESFPAGHVMANVAVMGFLIYLLLNLAKPSLMRALAIIVLASQIALIGLSRIYEGEHWFSDVLGGYLLGVLLLAATIFLYRWGRSRFFVRHRR